MSRGAIKHKNFSVDKLTELKLKLRFLHAEDGWLYFEVKVAFGDYKEGQIVKVKNKEGAKKIALVEA